MGGVYARVAFGVARPRIGLLSIGEEETKGNELTREAHRLLKSSPLNFIGNIEGREIYSGDADVVVCDGFTGNIVLKTSEGLVETVEALLGDELQGTFSSQVGPVRPSALEGNGKAPYTPRGGVTQAQYHFLFPATTINIAPGSRISRSSAGSRTGRSGRSR